MNQEQVLSAVRWLLTLVGPSIIATGWVSGSMWESVAALAPSVVALLWSMFVHTDTNAVKTAMVLTGGVPISIGPSATPAIQTLAADRSVPMVVPASPYGTSGSFKS